MMTKSIMTSKLKLLREEAKLSQEDILRELWSKGHKVSISTLIRAEQGHITLRTARALAEFWKIPLADIVGQ